MVNFRQELKSDIIEEWRDHYIDYEQLHNIIDNSEKKIQRDSQRLKK